MPETVQGCAADGLGFRLWFRIWGVRLRAQGCKQKFYDGQHAESKGSASTNYVFLLEALTASWRFLGAGLLAYERTHKARGIAFEIVEAGLRISAATSRPIHGCKSRHQEYQQSVGESDFSATFGTEAVGASKE